MKLEKKQSIPSSMLASDGKLSKIGAFQIIQDAITELMGKYHLDAFAIKEKYDAFWVFTKTRVKFLKPLSWNQNITISCYLSSLSFVKINVDVEIKDDSGALLIYSKTELCSLNFHSQKIMRISALEMDSTMIEEKNNSEELNFTKFEIQDLPLLRMVQIHYTNIDIAHHTNNLEYIRLILDSYSVQHMETKSIREIEIIYCNQSFENDNLNIRKINRENYDYILIEKENQPIVKCEIVYN